MFRILEEYICCSGNKMERSLEKYIIDGSKIELDANVSGAGQALEVGKIEYTKLRSIEHNYHINFNELLRLLNETNPEAEKEKN